MQVAVIIYLGQVQPFKDRGYERMETFNEITTLLLVYFLAIFTDWVPSRDTHFDVGWVFCCIVIFNIVVHMVVMWRNICRAARVWHHNYKLSKKLIPEKTLATIAKEKEREEELEEEV